MDSLIAKLYKEPKTIFTNKDLALIWQETNTDNLKAKIAYYVKQGVLTRLTRGVFSKGKHYDPKELATSIYRPSYISFETVLTRTGINFQYYGNIFVATYVTRDIEADGQKISFVRMKDYVLSNTAGIEHEDGIARATKERSFLDRVYISKDYHFDNLDALDWDKVFEILPIYHNKRMEKKVRAYFKYYSADLPVEASAQEGGGSASGGKNSI